MKATSSRKPRSTVLESGMQSLHVVRGSLRRLRTEAAICHKVAGPQAVLALSSNLLTGKPEYLTLRSSHLRHRLSLRLHTSDAAVYRDTFIDKEYEFPLSFEPCSIVDAGANCGMTAVFYANRYPQAKIIAIEPEPSNFAALVKNTAAYPQVIPICAALWNQDGEVDLFPGWRNTATWGKWGFRVRDGKGSRAITVPTLMRKFSLETIDVLKIDVEGAEREIFATCDWMEKVKFLAIELHDRFWPGCTESVDAAAKSFRKVERDPVTFYSR
jgi:FkbM family methyltransferase